MLGACPCLIKSARHIPAFGRRLSMILSSRAIRLGNPAGYAPLQRVLILLTLVCLAPFGAFAQSGSSRQLTLIHPDNPEFETLLNSNFPGLERLDGFAIFRPYLVLLRNDTSHIVRAYMMSWERQSSSTGRPQPINSFVERYDPAPAVERAALAPGELRLVSPTFDVSPKEYQSIHSHNWVALQLSTRQAHPPYSLTDTQSITTSVDAVFDDGSCVGADHREFLERYQRELDAERDMAQEVLRLLDAKTSEAEVLSFLKSESDAAAAASTAQSGDASIYAFYRGRQAQTLFTMYRRGGMEKLMTQAWTVTQHRPQKLSRVSSE